MCSADVARTCSKSGKGWLATAFEVVFMIVAALHVHTYTMSHKLVGCESGELFRRRIVYPSDCEGPCGPSLEHLHCFVVFYVYCVCVVLLLFACVLVVCVLLLYVCCCLLFLLIGTPKLYQTRARKGVRAHLLSVTLARAILYIVYSIWYIV